MVSESHGSWLPFPISTTHQTHTHTLRHTHSQTYTLSGIHIRTNIESNFSEQEMHVNTQSLAMATRLSLTVCLRSGELGPFSFSWLLGDLVSMVIVALRPTLLLFRELVMLQLCRHAEIINLSISYQRSRRGQDFFLLWLKMKYTDSPQSKNMTYHNNTTVSTFFIKTCLRKW